MNEPKTRPYQPSNSTDFEAFCSQLCANCTAGEMLDGDGNCDIQMRVLFHNLGEEEYPEEWQLIEGKPTCTAFHDVSAPPATPRCKRTIDMFENVQSEGAQ